MADVGNYASGNWFVKEGSEDAFISRWREFLKWTRDNSTGFQGGSLIRDTNNPRHFVSIAHWSAGGQQDAWRSLPEFAAARDDLVALCDDAQGSAFKLTVSV